MLKGKSTNENKKTGEEAFKADLGVFDNLIREGNLQLVEIVTSILKEHLEESIQKKHYPENLLKVIEVVRAFVYQKEYLVVQENSRIIVAKNLKTLLRAFKEGIDITKNISPRKFEELVDYIYRVSGNETELTKATRDNGVEYQSLFTCTNKTRSISYNCTSETIRLQ